MGINALYLVFCVFFVVCKILTEVNIVMSALLSRSMILSRRSNDDDSRDGFTKWPFMTTHTWGEYPQGTWTLEVIHPAHRNNKYGGQFNYVF